MNETNPEQNEKVICHAAKIYDGLVANPVIQVEGESWPNAALALRIAAKGALFMNGYGTESTNDVVEVVKKILPNDGENQA